jgi:histidine kinase/DNA gyrase B/HSP90-like ATPase
MCVSIFEYGGLQVLLVLVWDISECKGIEGSYDRIQTSKGLGMGLAISRSTVEAHGGRLWATANVPHGAVFQFTLPVDDGNQHD